METPEGLITVAKVTFWDLLLSIHPSSKSYHRKGREVLESIPELGSPWPHLHMLIRLFQVRVGVYEYELTD